MFYPDSTIVQVVCDIFWSFPLHALVSSLQRYSKDQGPMSVCHLENVDEHRQMMMQLPLVYLISHNTDTNLGNPPPSKAVWKFNIDPYLRSGLEKIAAFIVVLGFHVNFQGCMYVDISQWHGLALPSCRAKDLQTGHFQDIGQEVHWKGAGQNMSKWLVYPWKRWML